MSSVIQKTHFACRERVAIEGVHARCCDCQPHEGCELIKEVERLSEADRLTSIEAIEAHQFYGVHYYDALAFVAIDQFIKREDIPMDQKVRALSHLSRLGMGIDDDIDEQDVVRYVSGESC